MPTVEKFIRHENNLCRQGSDYRCHINVGDFREQGDGVRVNVLRAHQSQHPDVTFENMDKDGEKTSTEGT